MSTIRLDKYLSDAGSGTRSQVKEYIKKGYVTVNGVPAKKPEEKITLDKDIILFQNKKIYLSEFEYYLLNKPAGYVSATKDNINPTVISLINSKRKDLFPVGRLDKDTEGLLFITNDGKLSHKLSSPKYHIDKTYYALLDGKVGEKEIHLFASGIKIGDEDLDTAMPAKLNILSEAPEHYSEYYDETINSIDNSDSLCHVTVTIQEGKYHQVKRMFRAVGRKVLYLRRVSFGNISLPIDLKPGEYRTITAEELNTL